MSKARLPWILSGYHRTIAQSDEKPIRLHGDINEFIQERIMEQD